MVTKTVSIRLDKTLFDRIDSHCVTKNCTRNDFVKFAIESALDKNKDDVVVRHEPYYDKYGNYYTYDEKRKIWTCRVNMDNVKIKS
ncbi:MAG: hypothetical protein FJ356_03115 [Thaumarchaeota archaeon]|nr:hypothetical protein [Nitrososphaerota archaeon]